MAQNEMLTVDIRPESDIYETYRRLSYQPWYAIAEFVDNSTANFFEHREELAGASSHRHPALIVDIFYDRDEGTLTISDNALGMESTEFIRALQLAKPPANITGRSEFGMGLKTAACWMGPRWTVTSKQLNSTREFSASLDVARLKSERPKSLDVVVRDGLDPSSHYTRVEIGGMTEYNRIFVGRTIGKIKSEIASMYRRDIESEQIRIRFNGEDLTWKQPELLIEVSGNDNFTWRKDLRLEIEGKVVAGWIGLLARGRAASAGFHLFRRGRLVAGGQGQGWKPWEIFGAPNTFQSQRLIGELDFDEWGISHTKDRIEWSGPDEQQLIEELRKECIEYIAKARQSRREVRDTMSRAVAETVVEQTREEAEGSDEVAAQIVFVDEGHVPEENFNETDLVRSVLEEVGDSIEIKFGGTAFPALRFHMSDQSGENEQLVRLGFPQDDVIHMLLNLRHPFVEQFVSDNEKALRILVHILYVDALLERSWRRNPSLTAAQLRCIKDNYLRALRPVID